MAINTNRDYLKAQLAKFGLTDDDVDLIMVENPALSGSLNIIACKQAMHKSFSAILPLANVSEGGFSQSWNMDAVKLWYKSLCSELGKPNFLKPQIRNRSNSW
jgi:hypothetical protein